MENKYFIINDKQQFLWDDGNFYNAFVKTAFAVDEKTALRYEQDGCIKELVNPNEWPALYKPTSTHQRMFTRGMELLSSDEIVVAYGENEKLEVTAKEYSTLELALTELSAIKQRAEEKT